MINNSTNIIKTNNHLSPSLTDHEEKTMTHDVGNPGPGLRQAQKFSVLKSVSVILHRASQECFQQTKRKPTMYQFHHTGDFKAQLAKQSSGIFSLVR
jgi:hypothetical protein